MIEGEHLCLWCEGPFTPRNEKHEFCHRYDCKRSYEHAVRVEAADLFDKHNRAVMAALRAKHGDRKSPAGAGEGQGHDEHPDTEKS